MKIAVSEQDGVWIYRLCTEELAKAEVFAAYYDQMSQMRRSKIDRLKREADKRRALGAGVLLDEGLKKYGLSERNVKIEIGENGKPYLPDHPQIHFNLSHSGKQALAVFADTQVGCDIEQMHSAKLSVARRFFCPSEYAWLISQPTERRQEAFYRIWTLKESFMKATGLGMKLPLDAFEFLLGREEVKISQSVDEAEYRFIEFAPEEYRAAVCVREG